MLLFLYNTGARADEAAHVRIADLELGRRRSEIRPSVLIHGKGNKLRRCPLWARTVNELLAVGERSCSAEPVFLNRRGQPLTRFGIHALVERYAAVVAATQPSLARQACESAHDPPHDSDAPAACWGGHQHDPCLAGSRLAEHDEHLRGSGSGNEGQGPGELRRWW